VNIIDHYKSLYTFVSEIKQCFQKLLFNAEKCMIKLWFR